MNTLLLEITQTAPRFIVSIVPDGEVEAQCIRIAHLSRLYITDDLIPTHNTYADTPKDNKSAATPATATDKDSLSGAAEKKPARDFRLTDKQKAELSAFLNGEPIAEIPDNVAPISFGFAAIRKWATGIFERQGGKAKNPELGDVVLDERAVRDSQGHGKMNRAKANAFAAVGKVIEQGRVVLREGRSEQTDSIYISAPVRIGGVDNIVTALVHRDQNTQRMYLHSVSTKESLLNDRVSSADTEVSERSGSNREGGIATVLHDLINFKGQTNDESFFSRVWHGSPYNFEKFMLEHMGTGEGAQSFGWGLYFTDSRDLGESYRKNLSGRNIE
jgi:hypothetical protein